MTNNSPSPAHEFESVYEGYGNVFYCCAKCGADLNVINLTESCPVDDEPLPGGRFGDGDYL
jgi:hypothetical protein